MSSEAQSPEEVPNGNLRLRGMTMKKVLAFLCKNFAGFVLAINEGQKPLLETSHVELEGELLPVGEGRYELRLSAESPAVLGAQSAEGYTVTAYISREAVSVPFDDPDLYKIAASVNGAIWQTYGHTIELP
ncbi:MAG TPA: hypothetical protein VNK23_03035 [Candidatus Dormibacteraeota bacterium]|nr:hypothetical protein [Candidatus Dormibacteraeota bacterium]